METLSKLINFSALSADADTSVLMPVRAIQYTGVVFAKASLLDSVQVCHHGAFGWSKRSPKTS